MIRVLLLDLGALACALPVAHVIETMRPLPVEAIAGAPPYVRGVSIIRGAPTPVVDPRVLLEGSAPTATYGRFVTIRTTPGVVALAVDAVVGLRSIDLASLAQLPPLLGQVEEDVVEAVGALDAQLLVVLRAAHIVPASVRATLGLEDVAT